MYKYKIKPTFFLLLALFEHLKDDGILKFVIQGGALRIRIRPKDADPGTTRIPLTSVADPDPRSGTFLTPGSGIRDGKKK
jgi:hypothetical protein